jgi:very-short-patch-repair endonuclease
MTKQEKHLWYDFLVNYPVRFQRQKTIDNFIADFYCFNARLIIEIDGSHHFTPEGMIKDEFRTTILEKYNLKVLRFSNSDINTNFAGVCDIIDYEVKQRITPSVTS